MGRTNHLFNLFLFHQKDRIETWVFFYFSLGKIFNFQNNIFFFNACLQVIISPFNNIRRSENGRCRICAGKQGIQRNTYTLLTKVAFSVSPLSSCATYYKSVFNCGNITRLNNQFCSQDEFYKRKFI